MTGNTGKRSVRVAVSRYTSGDAKWVFDSVSVTAGSPYIYRAYYKSTVSTKLIAAFTAADGTVSNRTLATAAASSNWSTIAVSITVPSGTSRLSVYHAISAVGSLQLDDVSVALPQRPDLSSGVPNGSFEQASDLNLNQPLAWQKGNYGTNVATFTYATDGHTGSRSAIVTVSSYTNGDAKWYFDPQPVVAGTRYLFSDYYVATVPSFINVRLTMTDGSYKYINWGETPAAASYVQTFAAFVAPEGAVAATVFHGLSRAGTLQIDDVALAALADTRLVNGVPNGDLEQQAYPAPMPVAWYQDVNGTNTSTSSYANDGHSGVHSLRVDITAYTSGFAAWYFDPQPVTAGQLYKVEDYYRSDMDTKPFAQVTLSDGSVVQMQLPKAFASSSWTKYSADLIAPANAVSLTFMHCLEKVGYLQIDDVSLSQLTLVPFQRPLVSLTFDDGWASNYNTVLPILTRHNVPATHYIVTAYIADDGGSSNGYLSLSMIAALFARGDEIGSHTVNHYDLTTLSASDLASELTSSKQFLDSHGFGPVVDFASPLGAYNGTTLAAIGIVYQSHRTTDVGYNISNDFDPLRLKVQNVMSTTTSSDIASWAAQAANTGSWLVLVYHNVVASASDRYSITPENLESHISALEAAGLTFLTVRQALTEIAPQLATASPK
jgi:peptidoglycan/xylan/chitin deacetylase (PgdA/CDA1 family)